MEFLINVLPNHGFTAETIKQFILNVEDQHRSNVTLVFKKVPSLTPDLVKFIKKSDVPSIFVQKYSDVLLNASQQTYWINLHVTDCLLPNAITQWQQIIERHSSDVIELAYLHNEKSLVNQTGKLIQKIDHRHPVRVNTVKTVLHLPLNVPLFNLSLSSQLLMILGLQNYKVMDTIQRYDELKNVYLGFNFLVHCSSALLKSFDAGLVNTLVKMIINRPEIVKINLPTVILSKFSLRDQIVWFAEVAKAVKYIGDANLLNKYQKFANDQFNRIKKAIFHAKISRFTKHHLMSKINHVSDTFLQAK